MKLTIATLFALVAAAVAYPTDHGNGELTMANLGGFNPADTSLPAHVKRQNIVTMDVAAPAMSDGSGPIPFDAVKVADLQRRGRLV